RGFAGLALLVSDVGAILRAVQGPVAPAPRDEAPAFTAGPYIAGTAPAPGPTSAAGIEPLIPREPEWHPPGPLMPRKRRRLGVLVAGLVGIAAVAWLAGLLDRPSGEPAPAPRAAAGTPATPVTPPAAPVP